MREQIGVLLIAALLMSLPLSAQVPDVPDVLDDEPVPADADPTDDVAEAGEDDNDSPEYEDDLDDFIPSEEVPPDEQVTFPVDI